jgi:hypothetical protein
VKLRNKVALLSDELGAQIALGIVFFGLLTPAGLIMRGLGRDRLRLRFSRREPSYWVLRRSRSARPTSMARQF